MNISNGIENLSQILSSTTLEPAAATAKVPQGASQTTGSADATGQIDKADKADLSAAGTQAAQSVGSDTSDVRLDKVASIRAALEAGTYSVPASAVAQKLIGSMLEPQK